MSALPLETLSASVRELLISRQEQHFSGYRFFLHKKCSTENRNQKYNRKIIKVGGIMTLYPNEELKETTIIVVFPEVSRHFSKAN